MCYERISRGQLPVCVKACATGAMNFGERQEMLALAVKRLTRVQKEHPKAILADAEQVNAIYLLMDDPEKYHTFSVARHAPELSRKAFLAKLGAPVKNVAWSFRTS